jgi:hypothetical protein
MYAEIDTKRLSAAELSEIILNRCQFKRFGWEKL